MESKTITIVEYLDNLTYRCEKDKKKAPQSKHDWIDSMYMELYRELHRGLPDNKKINDIVRYLNYSNYREIVAFTHMDKIDREIVLDTKYEYPDVPHTKFDLISTFNKLNRTDYIRHAWGLFDHKSKEYYYYDIVDMYKKKGDTVINDWISGLPHTIIDAEQKEQKEREEQEQKEYEEKKEQEQKEQKEQKEQEAEEQKEQSLITQFKFNNTIHDKVTNVEKIGLLFIVLTFILQVWSVCMCHFEDKC